MVYSLFVTAVLEKKWVNNISAWFSPYREYENAFAICHLTALEIDSLI